MIDKSLDNKRHLAAILIPVYKPEPDENDKKSLGQCLTILGNHPIVFFGAHNFDFSYYQHLCKLNDLPFEKLTFNSKFFQSKEDYNKLCLTKNFYKAFNDFKYILIYQLDAWVFSDNLEHWCDKGYDYIGAPFPADLNAEPENVQFSVVGNGGFSLRRVKAMINVFDHKYHKLKKWHQIRETYKERIMSNPLWWVYCIIRTVGYRNTINYLRKKSWEDHFFFEVARLTSFIRIPEPLIALEFSFEYRPSIAFMQNGNRLPMGCHGWPWIEYEEFWNQFIK